jgi:hypothetical protein
MPAAKKGPPASTTKAAAAGAGGEILCEASWSATQWLNLGPLGLTVEYPPWIVPMIATEPGGGLFFGFNAKTTDLASGIQATSYFAIVSKLGADCQPLWVRPLVQGESDVLQVTSVQSDSQGNLVLAGWFSGTLDFGDGAVAESANGRAFFISKLDADGSHLWTRVHAIGENIAELRIIRLEDDRRTLPGWRRVRSTTRGQRVTAQRRCIRAGPYLSRPQPVQRRGWLAGDQDDPLRIQA